MLNEEKVRLKRIFGIRGICEEAEGKGREGWQGRSTVL
jgi:hypothetical protein